MKKTNRILIVLFLFTICCKCELEGDSYTISLKNESNDSILCYTSLVEKNTKFYPDTSLSIEQVKLMTIGSMKMENVFVSHNEIQEVFKYFLPSDTLSVFIIHPDTLNSYPWEIIRAEYKILKRYDLSIKDLESMNWTIT